MIVLLMGIAGMIHKSTVLQIWKGADSEKTKICFEYGVETMCERYEWLLGLLYLQKMNMTVGHGSFCIAS